MSMERKNCDSEVLLRGLRQGDERAFRILFEEFYTALCLFATRFLGDSEAAADVVLPSNREDGVAAAINDRILHK